MSPKSLLSSTAIVAALALTSAAETYSVDAVHSSVIFRVKHMDTSYAYGRFNDIAGSFDLDSAQPKLEITVKTGSVDTANAKRDQHLKGPDFFSATQYPTITFKSTKVTKSGSDAYEVAGDLTMHGVTKPVTVKLVKTGAGKDFAGKAIAGVEGEFRVKRSDFGMTKMVGPVGDEVTVVVAIEAVKA